MYEFKIKFNSHEGLLALLKLFLDKNTIEVIIVATRNSNEPIKLGSTKYL